MKTHRRGFLPVLLPILLLALEEPLQAGVKPPLVVRIEAAEEKRDGFAGRVRTLALSTGPVVQAKICLEATATGVASVSGRTEWVVERVEPGKEYSFPIEVRVRGYGEGSVRLQADSFDATGKLLWGRADTLFLLETPEDRLRGHSSIFELKREKLARDRGRSKLSEAEHGEEFDNLLRGRELRFEREMRGLPPKKEKEEVQPRIEGVVPSAVVSGKMTYTHRIGRGAGGDVFAAAANALPLRRAKVEFYDDDGGTLTKLTTTPPVVMTNNTGTYSAIVPGKRADMTAVNLRVRLLADNPAVRIGPEGQRASIHQRDSAALLIDAAAETVNMTLDDTDLLALGVFSLMEGMLQAFDYVKTIAGGKAPVQVFLEFPGTGTVSFFSTIPDDHFKIIAGDAFDWDVYTHEYGHYVQNLNNTSQSPGGCHTLNGNNSGLDQNTCGGPNRTLTKDEGEKLAWGEGWASFFGTLLQIASGAGSLGIHTVADTKYTDTTDANFSVDLEDNNDKIPGTGEDNELSVQRILWDFADAPQDGHDDLSFGHEFLSRRSGTDPTIVTLDAFRATFDPLVPPFGSDIGTPEQNRAKKGRIYGDMNVGPEPTDPPDYSDIPSPRGVVAPTFEWKTKGGGKPPSYRFHKFLVKFFDENSVNTFTSPEIVTAANAETGMWTPTMAEWEAITSADPATKIIKWAVEGKHDSEAPATGFYRGLDRTLGRIDVAFVIDDTGSMMQEISGVRAALSAYIAVIRGLGLPKNPLIEVITFKDDVNKRLISDDLDAVQAVVDALSAGFGADCPEASGQALMEALRDAPPNKTIIFATDASPHAGFDLSGVKQRLRDKNITLVQLVTGDCNPAGGARAQSVVADSFNGDPSWTPPSIPPLTPEPDVYGVSCPDCPPDASVGPALSANALKLPGEFGLVVPSTIASWGDVAASSPGGKFFYFPGVKTGDSGPFQNAVTNAALTATVATVVGARPGDLPQGATLDVLLLGGNTNFSAASTVAFSGTSITVNSKTVLSPTSLLVNVTVGPAAALGFRDVTVMTPLGAGVIETTAGTGQVRVVTNPGTALIVSVQPPEAARGTTVDITISGINTHFAADSVVSVFGIPINSTTVLGPTTLRANISIPSDAALGFHLVRVTTGPEVASNAEFFRIVSLIGPKATAPTISGVDPASKGKGATFDLEVTGLATNFTDGVSFGSLNSTGIDVLSTNVTSPTSAILRVRLGADTELGFHDVLVTTGGEVASIPDGFQVTANPTTMDPTSGPSAGGTPFVVTSTDFQAGAGVTVGGAAAMGVSVPDATHVNATAPARPPGTLHDVVVSNPDGTGWTLFKGWLSDFSDVPQTHGFHDFIERLFRAAITSGCAGGNYCPASSVTRAQMAIFLLRGKHGSGYQPPPATGTAFSDVPAGAFAAAWIEQLAEEGITSGCGGGNYCPNNPVTREQMAIFLLRAKLGSDHVPPDPTGVFGDVPVSSPFAKWIEELASLGITSGCGGGNYCPTSPSTRGQMAVFLVKTFNLP